MFPDRTEAGRQLAASLSSYAGRDVVVLALPRGGVPVAVEVARALNAPLDVFLVRKIGVPGHEELAMGAAAEGGVTVLNHDLIDELGITSAQVDQVAARERIEIERRSRVFRGSRPAPDVAGRTVILIDDGLATGSTMEAAILALRERKPASLVVAVPVGARDTAMRLGRLVDEIVVLSMPEPFYAVGGHYDRFEQLSDEQVTAILTAKQ